MSRFYIYKYFSLSQQIISIKIKFKHNKFLLLHDKVIDYSCIYELTNKY